MKVIGIDLDGTLAEYDGWKGIDVIGPPKQGAGSFLRALKEQGWTICVWSTRADVYVDRWLSMYDLQEWVNFINTSPYPCDSHKQSFDVYVGDEAIRFEGDYAATQATIEELARVRHWGEDTFERNPVESDRNPSLYMRGTGMAYLDAFEGLTEELWREYDDEPMPPYAFLTICSHAKPYSKSWIHCRIRERLYGAGLLELLEYIHISNAGIIPHWATKSFEVLNSYDWNSAEAPDETIQIHKARIQKRLAKWYELAGHSFSKIFVYLRINGNTANACKDVFPSWSTPVVMIPTLLTKSPPWAAFPDVDDCLANPDNLQEAVNTLLRETRRDDHV